MTSRGRLSRNQTFIDGVLVAESLVMASPTPGTRAEITATSDQYGARGDGVSDDTDALQRALDAVDVAAGVADVYVPSGVYLINAVRPDPTPYGQPRSSRNAWIGGGLRPKSGTRLRLAPDAILKVIPNGSLGYACIYLGAGQDNITITGGKILGDRATHDYATEPKDATHEWGYGIALRGATDIHIDRVAIEGCTGDGIFAGAEGLKNYPGSTYIPSRRLVVTDCVIDGNRRNNISITAADVVTIEGCTITRAGYNDGIHDGTAPRFGIDVEGYGEGSIDFESVDNVTIHGNRFEANVAGAVMNYNGYGVTIDGNFADNIISFGFGTETTITGNIVKSTKATGDGIGSNWRADMYPANCVISGNVVAGFANGISVKRDRVLVVGNHVSGFASSGVSVFGSSDVAINANHATAPSTTTAVGVNVGSSTDVTITGNRLADVSVGVSLSALKSDAVDVTGNTIAATVGFRTLPADCEATVTNNTLRLPVNGRLSHVNGTGVVIDANTVIPNT